MNNLDICIQIKQNKTKQKLKSKEKLERKTQKIKENPKNKRKNKNQKNEIKIFFVVKTKQKISSYIINPAKSSWKSTKMLFGK